MHKLYRLVYFIPAITWLILIWSLSTTSNLPPIPWNFLSPDKIGHLVFYAIATLLLIWGFARYQQWQKSQYSWIFIAMLIAGCYGVALEYVQAGIPGRAFDYADMIANWLGTIVGILVYRYATKKYFISVS